MVHLFEWYDALLGRFPELRLDLLGRLALAAMLGGAIGWEREYSRKPAGLRTHMLICVGAALLADLSLHVSQMGPGPADPGRIAAQVVSGIGFLGAGTIIQARGSVTGLTTAATMWVVAAIGLSAGYGADVEAVGTTLLVMIALVPLRLVEARTRGSMRRLDIDVVDASDARTTPLGERPEG
jgi:putative Mg2+ transporter-C (MgtC) family protein